MSGEDRRKSAELSSAELAEKLGSSTLPNVRSSLAPLTAALRSRINVEDPSATPESAEAALALRFVYRAFLGRRRNDRLNPENMAFARLLSRHIADMAAGIENAAGYQAEDIPLYASLTLGQIHQYVQSAVAEPQILLSTQGLSEEQAIHQRTVIEQVMENFVAQNQQVFKESEKPELGLTVYSTTVFLPDSDYYLICRSHCWEGTSLPADTELVLLPPSAE